MLPTNHQRIYKEDRVCDERIRQARWTFNLSIAFVGTSTVITLAGVVCLIFGRISPGAYATTAGGLATTAGGRCVQISKEANDRLDSIMQNLNDRDESE